MNIKLFRWQNKLSEISSYLNSINLAHLSYTVCSTSYFGDKYYAYLKRWTNSMNKFKFAWHRKIFIWLINFILITKTFFTVDHVQSTCIDSYQSFKVSRLRLQHEQSWKVQGFVKEKKCPLQCECYLKLWSIQTSKGTC